jgi:hypothetical protein
VDRRTQLVTMRREDTVGQARRACALPDKVLGTVRLKPDDLRPAGWTRDAVISRSESTF